VEFKIFLEPELVGEKSSHITPRNDELRRGDKPIGLILTFNQHTSQIKRAPEVILAAEPASHL
jgi:hypothetical protein